MNRVLLLGEDKDLQSLALELREFGIDATTARNLDGARSALAGAEPYKAVVAQLSDFAGGRELQGLGHRRIAIAERFAFAEVRAALGRSIDDCIVAPLRAEELLLALHRSDYSRQAAPLAEVPIIGIDGGLAKAWKLLEKAAGFETDVQITGESGTGKELFARALHRKSKRANGPFVAVNCAAIPHGLLESQLFGHVKGAFTDAHQDKEGVFVKANGGTLFLDEIGDFPLELQAKLLRALQTGEVQPVGSEETFKVDLRLVSATSRNLEAMVAAKTFRDDLYYRLAVIPIVLPPLRERREDVTKLVDHFLNVFAEKHRVKEMRLSADARQALIQADWPGNVRQLQNAVERLVVLSEGVPVELAFVQREFSQHLSDVGAGSANIQGVALRGRPLKVAMHDIEARFIAEALEACSGKRARCAELLSISPRALLYKIKEHDL